MDIKVVDDAGQEVTPSAEPMESKQIVGGVFPELELKAVADVMGLEKESERGRYADKLNTLLEYAKGQTSDHSPENLKWIIRSLELKLGTPPLAEKRISYVARYAYLLREESRLAKEREGFERGNY